jgi:ABC-type multidrug transport system fused ATPase/permease subunit
LLRDVTTILRSAAANSGDRLAARALGLVTIAAAAGAATSATPALLGMAIDRVLARGAPPMPPRGLGALIGGPLAHAGKATTIAVALVATLLSVGLTMASMRLGASLGAWATAGLRTAMLRAALHAAPAERDEIAGAFGASGPRPPGAPAPPSPSGVDAIRVAIASSTPTVADLAVSMVSGLPQVVVGLALLAYDLVFSGAWLALGGGLAIFAVSRVLARGATARVALKHQDLQRADAVLFGRLGSTLGRSEDLRLLGARRAAVVEFAETADACARERAGLARALAVSGQVRSVFSALAPLLIVLALELDGEPPAQGTVAKLVLLVPLLLARLEAVDGLRLGLAERRPLFHATARVLELADWPARAPDAVDVDASKVEGALAFEDVRFRHPGADQPLLDGVTFRVPAGAVVGICGKSGSGKSTLLRLLLRGLEPDTGRVTVDGLDVARIEPDRLPDVFGVLGQHSGLLERSVRQNLGFGCAEPPTTAALDAVLEAVALDDEFGSRGRRGLDYEVRPGRDNLAGGEIRRLCLARVLLRDPPVLVLDEPEAALPSRDAEALLRRVAVAARGRTCLVVTHAPHLLDSTFNVVLEAGRVAGVGTHAELVEQSAAYRALLADALAAPHAEARAPAPPG